MIPENWELFQHSSAGWLVLILAAMIVGFSKTGVAGVGIVNPILFAMIFPAAQSVGFLLPLLIMADLFGTGNYWRYTQWKYVLQSMPWILAGVGVGYLAMRYMQSNDMNYDHAMQLAIGATVLGMVGLNVWMSAKREHQEEIKAALWLVPVFGVLTGLTTMMANAAGPIYSIFLLTFALPKKEFMGTRAMVFSIVNWLKLPLQWHLGNITMESLSLNGALFPAVAIGAYIGVKMLKRLPEKIFKRSIQILVILACVKLIWSGLNGGS